MRAPLLLGISILWIPLAFLVDGVTVLVLPVRLGGGATVLGLVSFIGLAVGAGVQLLIGTLGDRLRARVDRRLMAAAGAIPAVVGLVWLAGAAGLVGAILAYALIQAAAGAIQASQQALMPEHVRGDGRNHASGLKVAFDVGGAFVAFLLLGILLAGGGILPAIGATALILVVGTMIMLAFVPPIRPAGAPAGRFQVPSGFTRLVAARFLFLVATYAVGRFLVLLVADRLEIAPERAADEAGGLLAIFTLATAAVAVGFGALADRIASRELMVLGALAAAVGIGVLVPAMGIAGVALGGLLMSFGTGAFMTANWSATVALVPPRDAGRLMSIANLGTAVAAAVGGLVGPLIDVAGFGPALLGAAVISVAAIVPLMAASPRVTRTAESSP